MPSKTAAAPDRQAVKFRLVRSDDIPATNPHGFRFLFGIQDTKDVIEPGGRRADGAFVFDFTLMAGPGRDPGQPAFYGRFASGPAADRFVYLAWRALETGAYINRVKARLSTIGWPLIHEALALDRRVTADLTGFKPGSAKVVWSLD
jgi:hypothetical protein